MMQKQDEKKFGELLAGLMTMYDKKPNPMMIELYWGALSKYSLEDVKRAVNQHVLDQKNGRFFPKPADLLAYLEADPLTTAMGAWEKLLGGISRVGPYNSVVFDDPIIHNCIESMGGWIKVCEWEPNDLPYRANEFRKLYEAFRRKPETYPSKLLGLAEIHNKGSGYPTPLPRLVGDERGCMAVLEGGGDQRKLKVATLDAVKPKQLERKLEDGDDGLDDARTKD